MVAAAVAFLEMSPVHCRRVWTTTREGVLEIYREIPFTRQVQVINNLLPFTGPSTRKLNYSVYKPPPFINSPRIGYTSFASFSCFANVVKHGKIYIFTLHVTVQFVLQTNIPLPKQVVSCARSEIIGFIGQRDM